MVRTYCGPMDECGSVSTLRSVSRSSRSFKRACVQRGRGAYRYYLPCESWDDRRPTGSRLDDSPDRPDSGLGGRRCSARSAPLRVVRRGWFTDLELAPTLRAAAVRSRGVVFVANDQTGAMVGTVALDAAQRLYLGCGFHRDPSSDFRRGKREFLVYRRALADLMRSFS